MQKAVEEAAAGPRTFVNPSLKRSAADPLEGPRFRRGYLWTSTPENALSPAALSTETAPPLPSPPPHLLNNPVIQKTLDSLQGYIKVDTPFNIDRLETLLYDHPNQPFVSSVIRGLREGFWPFDEGDWKIEQGEVIGNTTDEELDLQAIRAYRDREVAGERWSLGLPSSTLLPGMKMSPMFIAWQKNKPHVITDHSASGLNDGIPIAEGRVKYDDMHPFGQTLYEWLHRNPDRRTVVFKSDVASAFLNLSGHPLWQMRQIVVVDGVWYIVRRLVFGNRASPRIWCSVSGLLCWIAVRKLKISSLHVYMDDFFGLDFEGNEVFYHGKLRPRNQVQLLVFWEFVCCPFEDKKQESGPKLKVIGFWVDANKGSISLDPDSVSDIQNRIDEFLKHPLRCPPLRDWQRLAGHLNWLLNVLPWGRPALSELYRKTRGKQNSWRGVYLNREVIIDLTWLRDVIPRSVGVRFVDSMHWDDDDADMVVWTDASLHMGLGCYYASNALVYQLHPPPSDIKIDIFFLELIAILSAIHHIASLPKPPRRLLLFTDSMDSVCVLNTLSASEALHTAPLLAIAEIILYSGIDLRVRHIAGTKNVRADMLSRLLLDDYSRQFPSDRVRTLVPPRELLPARWRECF